MTPARFEIGQKHKQENEAGSKLAGTRLVPIHGQR